MSDDEECDDGNLEPRDGCDKHCRREIEEPGVIIGIIVSVFVLAVIVVLGAWRLLCHKKNSRLYAES